MPKVWTSLPEIGLAHTAEIEILKFLLDEFSRNRRVSDPGKLKFGNNSG